MDENILLHQISPAEFKNMLKELVREEFQNINEEIQRVIGDDDLVSVGTACRLLGVCSKIFRYMEREGHFTVFHHLKEKRYNRGELLEFRNKYRAHKKREF